MVFFFHSSPSNCQSEHKVYCAFHDFLTVNSILLLEYFPMYFFFSLSMLKIQIQAITS